MLYIGYIRFRDVLCIREGFPVHTPRRCPVEVVWPVGNGHPGTRNGRIRGCLIRPVRIQHNGTVLRLIAGRERKAVIPVTINQWTVISILKNTLCTENPEVILSCSAVILRVQKVPGTRGMDKHLHLIRENRFAFPGIAVCPVLCKGDFVFEYYSICT